MKTVKISLIVLALAIALGGTYYFTQTYSQSGPNKVSKEKFNQWISSAKSVELSSKLQTSKNYGDNSFEVSFLPAELRVLRDLGNIDDPSFNDELNEARKLEVYQLKIKNLKGEDILKLQTSKLDYDQRIKYFSFELQNRITLLVNDKEIPCRLCHFERTFENSNGINIQLAFDASQIDKNSLDRLLRIEDDYFGIGTINIRIEKNILKTTPQII